MNLFFLDFETTGLSLIIMIQLKLQLNNIIRKLLSIIYDTKSNGII